jgi:HAD-superfamily hydrolase, subfamily IIB
MSKNKTLYISDLDGTLLNANAELSAYTKDVLNKMIADGLCFSVATARTAASAFKILDGVQWKVPLVLLNGVLIYDALQRRYVQVLPLSSQTAATIISTLKALNTTGLMYQLKNDEQVTYYETLEHKPLRNFIEERQNRYDKVFHKVNFSDVPPEDIIYFTLLDTHGKIQNAYEAFSAIPDICLSIYKDIYSSDLWYLEIHNDRATKQNGTLYLRETYGFEHIIGFGDNLNDLPMFAACDVKVAVENANPEVKAAADYICGTNNDDGVVKWIERNVI